jgi:hypothetical protein
MTCVHHYIEIPGSHRGVKTPAPVYDGRKESRLPDYNVFTTWVCKLCGHSKELPIEMTANDFRHYKTEKEVQA